MRLIENVLLELWASYFLLNIEMNINEGNCDYKIQIGFMFNTVCDVNISKNQGFFFNNNNNFLLHFNLNG